MNNAIFLFVLRHFFNTLGRVGTQQSSRGAQTKAGTSNGTH